VAPLAMKQSMEFIDEVADVAVQWSDMKWCWASSAMVRSFGKPWPIHRETVAMTYHIDYSFGTSCPVY
jgi:hypothetical protein